MLSIIQKNEKQAIYIIELRTRSQIQIGGCVATEFVNGLGWMVNEENLILHIKNKGQIESDFYTHELVAQF